jgi:hypothetical protein
LYGDSDANPAIGAPGRDSSTATMAANAPARLCSQRCWSSSDRGTRSKVLVVVATSWL